MLSAATQSLALDLAQMMIRDADGLITFWSEALVRLFGFTADEALGKRAFDLLRSAFPWGLAPIEAELMARGTWSGPLVHHRSDGTPVTLHSHWTLLRERDGSASVVETVVVSQAVVVPSGDLDARLHLAAIVENSDTAIISKTLDGIVTSWNAAAEAIFGYRAAEIIGRSINAIIPPERVEEERAILTRLGQGQRIRYAKTTRICKDGRRIAVALGVSPIRSASGEIIGASKLARDITAEIAAHERLAELQSEISRLSRTAVMGEMAAALAHELSQPLTALTNYSEALVQLTGAETLDLPTVKNVAAKLARQAARTSQVIQRVHDFAANRQPVRSSENVNDLVQDAVELGRAGTASRGISIRLELDHAAPVLQLDLVQIQQVLLNLLRNAVEAVEGSARRDITVSVHPNATGDAVVIAVADSGGGIPPEIRGRLFERFVSSKPNGLGIGLSLSREIVRAHGGELTIAPRAEGGTIASITLPMLRRNDAAA